MRTSTEPNISETVELPRRAPAATAPAAPADACAIAQSYHSKVRAALSAFVATSSRAADLASVFPAAAYTIAARTAPAQDIDRAVRLTQDGAPLRDVARALGLPLWLRRLPPQAFRGPIGVLPSSEMFTRRIANQLPVPARESAFWLASVSFASRACDEYFALWLASQRIFMDQHREPEKLFGILAAYAWFSTADSTRAHHLIVTPWRPEMAFDTAICAAKSWLNRLRLVLQVRDGVVTDPWLEPGTCNGFTFTPLLNEADILAEARAMQNCADQYGDRIARDKCRLFSIRRRGIRTATLEIGSHPREVHFLTITQLKARHNLPAPVEVWQAAHGWFATQEGVRRTPPMEIPDRPLDRAAWASLMQPYRTARAGARWLPQRPTHQAFADLDGHMAELARRGGVSSWLFT